VGEKNFDEAVIAMGEDFEGTLIATSVLKEAGVFISVKASNQRRGNVLMKMGADRVIFPERDMGRRLAQLISSDSVIDMLELPKGFVVEQVTVGPGFAGKTLDKLNTSNRFGIWILLVYQDDKPALPTASTRLGKGDIIIVFGQKSKMSLFEKENQG
jgi:trk system potassium uptake protein TrkA